jgi:putative heme-binding domain-containing protein
MFRHAALPFALLAALPLWGQHGGVTSTNPKTRPGDIRAGAAHFVVRCAGCHGQNGVGGRAPELTRGVFKYGSSDGELFQNVLKGIPGTEMIGSELDAEKIWQLVAYVRTLSAGKGAGQSSGDPARGRQLFVENNCSTCHMVFGQGGRSGPDLSSVGAERSLGDLFSSLRDPGLQVATDFWPVRLTLKDGKTIAGRRLNEDTFMVQILDSSGRLLSVEKAAISDFQMSAISPMPSFASLSETDLAGLVAYLATLRGVPEQ